MSKKSPENTTFRTLAYFWRAIKRYKWYALLTLLLTPLVVFIRAILAPIIFADLIDKASQGISGSELLAVAGWEIGAFLVLYILNKVVFEELRIWACWKMELLAIYDFELQCFDSVCEQSMQFHNDRFSGSLVSQINRFTSAFERLIDVFVWELYPVVLYILMAVIVLAGQAPWFALGIVIFTAVYILMAFLSFHKIVDLNEAMAEAGNKETGQLSDSITNILSVKSYAREPHERRRFTTFAHKCFSSSMDLMRASIQRDLRFSGVQIGMTVLILVFLVMGREWLGISIATLILMVNYSQSIMGELWNFNSIFKNINRAFGDAREMTLNLDTVDDVVDAEDAKPLELSDASVTFDHISFKHSDAKETIFDDFSLEIKPGERVGLVGISGSGKTTLTKLLLRFADVQDGAILVSGQDIKSVTQKSLRQNIAYVPQETSLFHRSIAENIAYGKPDASLEEIKRAAELGGAAEFIDKLPDGYDTMVGERGVKLSGGQRQRIAIARAILKDAPILVLDEATSALDSESEALIQSALAKLMENRTSVVIAHRLSTVAGLDRIVVLDNGKIVEQGTHKSLLANPNGIYHHLWSRQSGAFMEDE